jgi:RING finger protein 113A
MEADTSPPVALFKKRTNKTNLRKRPATPPPADSDSSSEGDYSDGGKDENGRQIKRPRKAGVSGGTTVSKSKHTTDTSATTKYVADRSATIAASDDATRQSNWYDETAPDALSAKNLLGSTRNVPNAAAPPDGTYKGHAGYSNFLSKNPEAPARRAGPVKEAATNVRTITITDYAPDVCKDYKQTGFCGFGDSCKFLHAREDYKQGWALDRDWEVNTKGKKNLGGTVISSANKKKNDIDVDKEEEEAAMLEKIPFACIICKEPYKSPVVTKCGHYYCEKCALQRYKKNPNCVACGAGTNGVFNVARNLQKLLDRKRKREKALQEEKDKEENEDDDEDQA